jgi:hypothetical protein
MEVYETKDVQEGPKPVYTHPSNGEPMNEPIYIHRSNGEPMDEAKEDAP